MEEIKKLYYSIGEVAAMFSTTASRIRFYENFFDLEILRAKDGDRRFTDKSLGELTKIFDLVKEGYHLKAIKNKLQTL
jgi:DNA-binding transcriptional MerR regulator